MKYKVNDILVSSYGYNCTLVDFYKVVKATEKSIWIQELGWKFTEDDGYGQAGKVVPVEIENNQNKIIVKRQPSDDSSYVKVDYYKYGSLWNGQPVYYNSYD